MEMVIPGLAAGHAMFCWPRLASGSKVACPIPFADSSTFSVPTEACPMVMRPPGAPVSARLELSFIGLNGFWVFACTSTLSAPAGVKLATGKPR